MPSLRDLPSVHALLLEPAVKALLLDFGTERVTDEIRKILEFARLDPEQVPDRETILKQLEERLAGLVGSQTKPVINATGVILHTNLGRAPLCKNALERLGRELGGYQALEFDLGSGKRGKRGQAAEKLLLELTGGEAALIVNNNAGMMLLCLTALLKGKKVAISRGQMVEIGGGFRMPEVFKQSGAKLMEIGTTNRVKLADYEEALQNGADALLLVHPSNYKITGFAETPELQDLAQLASRYQLPSIYDLGSGSLIETGQFGLASEPTVQDSLKMGFDLVCFSGDKLLGGPQAGIAIGKANLVEKMRKHPLFRALRADKLCLSALEETLKVYLRGRAVAELPVWQMISRSKDSIRMQAEYLCSQLDGFELLDGFSTVGGGSLPEESLPTTLLAHRGRAEKLQKLLREGNPAVIGRIEKDTLLIDLRTIQPEEESTLLRALRIALVKLKR